MSVAARTQLGHFRKQSGKSDMKNCHLEMGSKSFVRSASFVTPGSNTVAGLTVDMCQIQSQESANSYFLD